MRPFRTRERAGESWHARARRPAGVMAPTPAGWLLARQARARRTARAVLRVAEALALAALLAVHATPAMGSLTPPPVPSSEQVCGSAILDGGPSSPPPGAVSVPAGDNSGVDFTAADTTYWLAPGTHTIGTGQFSQIDPGDGSTFTGAPGAVLDGQADNQFAFAGSASNVTIEYLTIQDFIPPGAQGAVNVNGEPGWTEEFDTEQGNLPGAATMLGTDAVLQDNCLTGNGEYGFNAYTVNGTSALTTGPSDITMTGNEISYNDTCNWEDVSNFPITPPAGCTGAGQFVGCGCSGGGKFWAGDGADIAGNYVHGNYSVGLWADTNDVGFTFSGNYFAGNYADAIIYEISYNAAITGNTFVDNAWGVGPGNPGFPSSAIYLSESGSDSRVPGPYGTSTDITGNQFYDNWGGVVLWENANRFCSSAANTSTGYCTLVNTSGPAPPAATIVTCDASNPDNPDPAYISTPPGIDDCRWKTQNVLVSGNLFDFSPADIGASCTTANLCGFNGVFSEFGTFPPYDGTTVEDNITFSQGNLFSANTYCGPWLFDALEQGNAYDFATWQGSPYSQDPGSTLNGAACTPVPPAPAGPPRAPVPQPVQVPVRAGRH